MARITRTHSQGRRADGVATLEQRFEMLGVRASAVSDVLAARPLVGPSSIFGERPGVEVEAGERRRLEGFSPAPGFRFDVAMHQARPGIFVVTFSQPDRAAPYLAGDLVWFVTGTDDRAVFDEQINTARASEYASAPLHGRGWSLRRAVFFRLGHARVMAGAVARIAELAARR